jgi:thioredoxin reductase (NADPH)
VRRLGDSEVHDLRLARVQQHHVRGLHVAVDDAALVRVMQRARELGDDRERLAPGQGLAVLGDVRQRPALEVFERHVQHAGVRVAPDIVHHHDAGMRQPAGDAALGAEALLEARPLGRRHGERDVDRLQRDVALQSRVLGQVDDAHRAAAQLAADLVAADLGQRRFGQAGAMISRPDGAFGRASYTVRGMSLKERYKVVILGSGPAGLTAAIYASRANLDPLVVEGGGGGDQTDLPGGQLMLTTDVDNYPGFPDGIMGPALMDGFRRQAERFGTTFTEGTLRSADLARRPFVLDLAEGTVAADALIVATGARAKWLGLENEIDFRTTVGGVSACATCDGFFYKGKDVLVVGGGDTAMEEANFLTKFANRVTVVHRRQELRASKIMEDRARANAKIAWLLDSAVEGYLGHDQRKFTGARVRNLKTGETMDVAAGGLFMAIGHEPNTAQFKGQLDMDAAGYLLTQGGTTATNVPGVFAAGDVSDTRYRQAITAAGSGCMAAIDAERFLSHHE